MTGLILTLDFGGTKLSAALFEAKSSRQGRQGSKERQEEQAFSSLRPLPPSRPLREPLPALLDLRRIITPHDTDATYELAAMVALARELLAGRAPDVVGVSFGGPVDFANGRVRRSDHVPGWEGFPLRDRLAVEFGCPVAVDNDANVAVLGEHRFGAGRGFDDLLYVTVSTGVGGGWILGGRPWRGHEGLAGEIGHTVVDPHGPLCLCGQRGCVERLASGPYMAADYAVAQAVSLRRGKDPLPNPLPKGEGTPIPSPLGGARGGSAMGEQEDPLPNPLPWGEGTRITGRDVAERAAAGDEAARAILLRGAWALGVGLGNAANLINPQRIILGGGVTKVGEAWWAEVRRAAASTAVAGVTFDVVPATMGDDAPLWGALALALNEEM
jgi:glucokinase